MAEVQKGAASIRDAESIFRGGTADKIYVDVPLKCIPARRNAPLNEKEPRYFERRRATIAVNPHLLCKRRLMT